MSARTGPHPSIDTLAFLRAVDEHGREWPTVFGDELIAVVNETIDRVQLAGYLRDGHTLTDAGRAVLAAASKGSTSRRRELPA